VAKTFISRSFHDGLSLNIRSACNRRKRLARFQGVRRFLHRRGGPGGECVRVAIPLRVIGVRVSSILSAWRRHVKRRFAFDGGPPLHRFAHGDGRGGLRFALSIDAPAPRVGADSTRSLANPTGSARPNVPISLASSTPRSTLGASGSAIVRRRLPKFWTIARLSTEDSMRGRWGGHPDTGSRLRVQEHARWK